MKCIYRSRRNDEVGVLRSLCLVAVFVSSIGLGQTESAAPAGKSLEDCFQAALKRSELVGQQQELIRQAEENYRQAIGSVLPQINGYGQYQWQQANPNAGFNSFYPNPSSSTRLSLTQPLFQGFREFAGLSQAKSLVGASRYDKRQATTQLFLDTAQSYFTVVSLEQDLDNVTEEIGLYDKRIGELKQFKSIGRAKLSEVLTAQAQQATLKGQVEQVQGQIAAQRQVLAFITGFDPSVPLDRPQASTIADKPLESYVARLEMRPDVQGDMARLKAAEEAIPYARGGHFPSLSLQGDYYIQRTGPLNGVNWDAMLNLTVPIFSGGVVQSQVEAAVSKRDQAELQVSRTKRLGLQQIRTYFQSFTADHRQFDAYREATDLSEKDYKEELREYRLGLVTNLDVLQSLTSYEEAKRAYDRSRYAMELDLENVEAAAALRPAAAQQGR